jgi:hypothetical protein
MAKTQAQTLFRIGAAPSALHRPLSTGNFIYRIAFKRPQAYGGQRLKRSRDGAMDPAETGGNRWRLGFPRSL